MGENGSASSSSSSILEGLGVTSSSTTTTANSDKSCCNHPEGTTCTESHMRGTKHKVRDIDGNLLPPQDAHVHTWVMNKGPKGYVWNKKSKQTYNYTPVGSRVCSSYPSWVVQRGGK